MKIIEPAERDAMKAKIVEMVKTSGPYEVLFVHMGNGPYSPIDEDLLKPLLPECKIIVSCSAGYNEFDVSWMTENGIWFCNTREAVSEPTADMTIFLILAVLRDTTRGEKQTREGNWRGALPPTRGSNGLTLGILGMGGIGKVSLLLLSYSNILTTFDLQFVAKKAHAFNLNVKYYNRNQLSAKEEADLGVSYCSSMEDLLRESDVFSVNCPLNAKTTGLIGKKEFSLMKDGVFFVNTARGAIVDEAALVEAIKSGKVARAGLDVFTDEPKVK